MTSTPAEQWKPFDPALDAILRDYHATLGAALDARKNGVPEGSIEANRFQFYRRGRDLFQSALASVGDVGGDGAPGSAVAKSFEWPIPLSPEEIISESAKPVEWLIDPIVARRHVTLIYAGPKGAKSSLVTALALGVECGSWPCGGFRIPRPGRVGYFSWEDHAPRISRRLLNYARQIGLDRVPMVWDSVRAPKVEFPIHAKALVEKVRSESLDLVILDVIAYTFSPVIQNENASAELQPWCRAIRWIANESGAAILLVHHARKGGRGAGAAMQDLARGSSVLGGLADTLLLLERREDGDLRLESVSKDAAPARWIVKYAPETATPWTIRDEAPDDELTVRVLGALRSLSQKDPARLWSVAEVAGPARLSDNGARKELRSLARRGKVVEMPRPGRGGGMGYMVPGANLEAKLLRTEQLNSAPPTGGAEMRSCSP